MCHLYEFVLLYTSIKMEVKRIKISALLHAGHNKSDIAKRLNISRMTVHRVAKRLKNSEDLKD